MLLKNKNNEIITIILNIVSFIFLVTSILLLFTTYGSALKGVIQKQVYVESTEIKNEIISNVKNIIDNILVVEFVENYNDDEVVIEFQLKNGDVKPITMKEMIEIGNGKKDIQILYAYNIVDDNLKCNINYINWLHGPIYVKKEVPLLSVMQVLGKMYRYYVNSKQALEQLSIKPSNLMYYIEYENSCYSNVKQNWLDIIEQESVHYCYVYDKTYIVELEMEGIYNAVRDYLARPGFAKLDFIEDFLKSEGLLDDFGNIRSYVYGQLDWNLTEFWSKAAIGIAFDTSLSVDDSFVTFHRRYDICKTWAIVLNVVASVSIIVWLATGILFLYENRKKNMTWLDKQAPEVAWGGAILIGILSFILMMIPMGYVWKYHYALEDVGDIFGYYKIDGFWIFFLCIFLLIIWYGMLLRLIKRFQIRKRLGIHFKEESYFVKSIQFLYQVYLHRSITTQHMIEFCIFSIVSILNIVLLSKYPILFWLMFVIIYGMLFKILLNRVMWQARIAETIQNMTEGNVGAKVDITDMQGKILQLAKAVNYLGEGLEKAIENAIVNERMKTELLTNVSHDIKTPLTSIVNYVALLKGICLEDERAKRYLNVLEEKSIRLKQLTEDMVEVAKASSGNLSLDMVNLDLIEFLQQAVGEMEYKFPERNLELVVSLPEESYFIEADGNRLWRVVENLMNNAYKYSMPGTRVFIECEREQEDVWILLKNVSEYPLKKRGNELTERFVRGDESRSTEGSGLGLAIAKGFVEKMGGTLKIQVDGDLFKVMIKFKLKNACVPETNIV